MCLAKPGETRGLTGVGLGLPRQESTGRVFGRFWNLTDRFLQSKSRPLAGYPDPLITLPKSTNLCIYPIMDTLLLPYHYFL
jgi:hypothetical protein